MLVLEILAWSNSLSSRWVQDALRRVVTQAEISEADIEELASLCQKPHGLSQTKLEVKPLTTDDLPTSHDVGPVSLAAVTHVADVNALAPNETICFAKSGLTVIYGDNGTGKSGYARILKRACRARGSSEPILANALSEQPAGTPTAKLTVAVGGTETEHVWKDGSPDPAELGAVSVFDSSAAQVYVSDKTEVWFRPLGLDVLDKLASVCARVRARVEGERNLLHTSATWPVIPKETQAGQLLATLTALTPRDHVDRVATLSEEEKRELDSLAEVLAASKLEDPTKKANDLRLKAARLRRLVDEVKRLSGLFGTKSVARVAILRQEAAEAEKIAQNAAKGLAGQAVLAGLESPEWRQMWEHAREYSEGQAYPGHAFPHAEAGAKCVFCQQDIDSSARERLMRFEAFVRGDAQKAAAAKRRAVDQAIATYSSLAPGERTKDALDDLAVLNSDAAKAVAEFLDRARQCRTQLLDSVGHPDPVSVSLPLDEMGNLASGIEARATEMEKADHTEYCWINLEILKLGI